MNPHSLHYWLVSTDPFKVSLLFSLKAEPVKEEWTASLYIFLIFQSMSSSPQCCWGWIRAAFTFWSYLNLTLGPTVLSIPVSFLHVSTLLVTSLYTKDTKHFIYLNQSISAIISLDEIAEMMHVWLLSFPPFLFPFPPSFLLLLSSFFLPPSLSPSFLPSLSSFLPFSLTEVGLMYNTIIVYNV